MLSSYLLFFLKTPISGIFETDAQHLMLHEPLQSFSHKGSGESRNFKEPGRTIAQTYHPLTETNLTWTVLEL
jgi:hypothetical protein